MTGKIEYPKFKAGAFATRYNPLTNPPPALYLIMDSLRKVADKFGILAQKPAVTIRAVRPYSGETTHGPSDEASRFLFQWGCVIPLSTGRYLIDENRFRHVMSCIDQQRRPTANPEPDARIREILDAAMARKREAQEKKDKAATAKFTPPRGLKRELVSETASPPPALVTDGEPDLRAVVIAPAIAPVVTAVQPPTLSPPAPPSPPKEAVTPDNLFANLTMLLPSIVAQERELRKEFGEVIATLPDGLPELTAFVRTSLEDTDGEHLSIDVDLFFIQLRSAVRYVKTLRAENSGMKKDQVEISDTRDQFQLLVEAISKLLDQIHEQERKFDLGRANLSTHRLRIGECVAEIDQIRQRTITIRSVVAGFCREIEAMPTGKTLDSPEVEAWRGRVGQTQTLWDNLAKHYERGNICVIELLDRETWIGLEQQEMDDISSDHKKLLAKLNKWLELLDESLITFEKVPSVNTRLTLLRMGTRDLTQELAGMYHEAVIHPNFELKQEEQNRFAAARDRVQAMVDMFSFSWPTDWADNEKLAARCFILGQSIAVSPKAVRGRTAKTVITRILEPAQLWQNGLSAERLEQLLRHLAERPSPLLIRMDERNRIFYRPSPLAHVLAAVWSSEMGISEAMRSEMRRLLKEHDREMYDRRRSPKATEEATEDAAVAVEEEESATDETAE